MSAGFAETEPDGRTTLYLRNSDRVLMSRIRELCDEVARIELLDLVVEETFDVSVADFTTHYEVTVWNTGQFWHEQPGARLHRLRLTHRFGLAITALSIEFTIPRLA